MENLLNKYDTVSLEEINSIRDSMRLMRRHDTKFVFPRDKLIPLLECISPFYRILEIDRKRIFEYENLYFDTPSLFFYHQHHNQRFGRNKVRFRRYRDSDQCFFELKFKSNKRETIKDRIEQAIIPEELTQEQREFARSKLTGYSNIRVDNIMPVLWTRFRRMTFVGTSEPERITIDTDISFMDIEKKSKKIANLVVAEVKQKKFASSSPFIKATRELRIFQSPFSKYCTGVAILFGNVKSNRFKERIMRIEKLNGRNS